MDAASEFPVSCPGCGMGYQVPGNLAGAKVSCQSCGAKFFLPDFPKASIPGPAGTEKAAMPTPATPAGSRLLKNIFLIFTGAALVAGGSVVLRKEASLPDAPPPPEADPPARMATAASIMRPVGAASADPSPPAPPPDHLFPASGQATTAPVMKQPLPDPAPAGAALVGAMPEPSDAAPPSVTAPPPHAVPATMPPEAKPSDAIPQPSDTVPPTPPATIAAMAALPPPGERVSAPGASPPSPLPPSPVPLAGSPPEPGPPGSGNADAPLHPGPISPPPLRSDSRITLEQFLRATTMAERLAVSQRPDKIRNEMEVFHQTHPMGPLPLTELALLTEDRVPETGKKLHLYNVFLSDRDAPIPVAVEETTDGYRVDWQAFAESYSHRLRAFFAAPREKPGHFRVLLRRAHYFGPPVPGQDTGRICYSVDPPMRDETFQIWVDRESPVFREKLAPSGRAGWDAESYLIVELIWKGDEATGRWVGLQNIISENWRSP